jgi:hypothetical protein
MIDELFQCSLRLSSFVISACPNCVERTIKKLRYDVRNGKVRLARGKGGKLIPVSA